MTLFAFRGVKSHKWTFYDPIIFTTLSMVNGMIGFIRRTVKGTIGEKLTDFLRGYQN